jgi:hypothetical protein
MPGPVSDSRDPEFGTGANRADIAEATREVLDLIKAELGPQLKNIVEVVNGPNGSLATLRFNERELRIIRFGLNRMLEEF